MIELKYGDKNFELRNRPNEMTLGEFQKIINIINNDENDYYFMSWLNIIEILGGEELKNIIDDTTLYKVIKELNISGNVSDKVVPVVTYEGRTFTTEVDGLGNLKMRGIDLANIERVIKNNNKGWLPKVMAILYREDGESDTESNLNKRAKFFLNNMTADVVLPVSYVVNNRLISHIESIKNAFTNEEA